MTLILIKKREKADGRFYSRRKCVTRSADYWEYSLANIPYRSERRITIPFHDNWIFTIGSGFIYAKGDNRGREHASHGTKWRPIKWRQMCHCIGRRMWNDNPVILKQRRACRPEIYYVRILDDRHRYASRTFVINNQHDQVYVYWRNNKWEEASLLHFVIPPSLTEWIISLRHYIVSRSQIYIESPVYRIHVSARRISPFWRNVRKYFRKGSSLGVRLNLLTIDLFIEGA